MGNFLSILSSGRQILELSYLDCSTMKLRQYYASFKLICEGFTLDNTEFTQIFGPSVNAFAVWDVERRRRIDALEMFSGLILFSNARFEDKIQFLFEMFDLNEEGWLGFEEMQFMLLNCINASYRLYQLQQRASDEEIETFLSEYFCSDSQVDLQKLNTWASRLPEVRDFFQLINKEVPHQRVRQAQSHIDSGLFQSKIFNNFKNSLLEESNPAKFAKLSKLGSLKLADPRQTTDRYFNPQLQWVFGMRIEDIKEPMRCVVNTGERAANEKLLYFVGRVAIIYYIKLATQEFYLEHQQQISCLVVGKQLALAATGELSNEPSIHVWNIKNRVNTVVLRNCHRRPITHLLFFRNDRGLVSSSAHPSGIGTVIVVYNLEDATSLFSCHLDEPVVSLLTVGWNLLNESSNYSASKTVSDHSSQSTCFTDYQDSFLLVGGCSMTYYSLLKEGFGRHFFPMGKDTITCGLATAREGTVLTGHQNGALVKWTQFSSPQEIYRSEAQLPSIVSIVECTQSHKYCVLTARELYLVDASTLRVERRVIPEEMYRLRMVQMLPLRNRQLMLLSLLGQVVNVKLDAEPTFTRLHHCFRLEDIKASYYCHESNMLYVASNALVFKIDVGECELRNVYSFEPEIKCISATTKNIVVALSSGEVLVSQGSTIVERIKVDSPVIEICVQPKHLLLLTEKSVQLFMVVEGCYFSRSPRTASFEPHHPTKLQPTLNEKIFLIVTAEGDVLRSDLELKYSVVTPADHLPLESVMGKFSDITFLLSRKRDLSFAAGQNGALVFFNSAEDFLNRPDTSSHELLTHAAPITNMHLLNEVSMHEDDGDLPHKPARFMTVGSTDQMVVLWKNQPVIKEEQPTKPTILLRKNSCTALHESHATEATSVVRQPLKDSSIRISTALDPSIERLVQQILRPPKNMYQSQVVRGKPHLKRFPPTVSLKLSYVYGLETTCRNSVAYCHIYYEGPRHQQHRRAPSLPKKATAGNARTMKIPEDVRAQMEVCSEMLLPYTESHSDCQKYVLYFVDRILIRYCPLSKQQRFYDQHRYAVTCLAVHPQKRLVCSAEQPPNASSHASVHIWDCRTFETLKVYCLLRSGTVKQLEYSRDGKLIACLVRCSSSASICVLDWQNQRWLAHRYLYTADILDIKFDPYKHDEIAACGCESLTIYKCSSGTLLMKEQAVLQRGQTITCLSYISNSYGTTIESDILTGDNLGNIGLFICGKYIVVREAAHTAPVSCLKIGELFRYKTVLISAGEDEAIRIWDTKMNLINEVNMRTLTCLSSLPKHASFQPQSLDLYHCSEKATDETLTVLLVGTCNGDVLQAIIENQYRGLNFYVDERHNAQESIDSKQSSQAQKQRESIGLKWNLQLHSYPSSSPIRAAVHSNKLATATNCHQLYLWDLANSQVSFSLNISTAPTVLKFNHSGSMLAMGCSTGELVLYEVAGFSLVQFQQISHSGYSVEALEFSESDTKLGVSLSPIKLTREKIPYVEVLTIKAPSRQLSTLTTRDVERATKLVDICNRSSGLTAVRFMNFSGNESENQLLMWYLPGKASNDHQAKYLLWDIDKNDQRKSVDGSDFNCLNYSAIVRLKYSLEQQNTKEEAPAALLHATDMAQVGSILAIASSNGELALAPLTCFDGTDREEEWALSRTYRAHAGQITSVIGSTTNSLELFTVGTGSAIMKWTIQEEREGWDLDYTDVEVPNDLFEEPRTKEALDSQLSVLPKRKSIFQAIANQDSSDQSETTVKLRSIIGRNAYFKRNNILCDFNDTFISFSGCNLMLLHKKSDGIKQEFVKVDSSQFSVLPQISSISLSANRRLLYVGTSEENAKVITWDIGSKTCISTVVLKGILEVKCVKACQNSEWLATICLSTENQQRLLYLTQREVLASYNFDYSHNTKLHDLCFAPGEQAKFVTCGLHHLAEWRYSSQLLAYESYRLEDANREGLLNTYCFVFVRDNLVSGSEDGFLYVWEQKRITKRQEAHPKSAILALHCSDDSKIFASGGTDGKVILWQLSSNVLQKLYEYSTHEGPMLTRTALVRHHVQSVNIGRSKVVVGTRSGDIFQFERPCENDYNEQSKAPTLALPAFDHEEVLAIRFSPSSKNMYVLTKAGTLSLIEVDTLRKRQECQVDLHDKQLLQMFVCQITEYIILVFLDEVQVFDSLRKHNELIKLTFCRFNRISDAALSTNQHYLAVLIAANQTENAKLLVYTLNIRSNQKQERRLTAEPREAFVLYHVVENLSANVDFIDFSTDNEYLVFKNRDDSENFVVRLLSKERVNSSNSEFHIEWAGPGKKTLESVRAITSFYNEDNHMLGLAQIMDRCVVATDEMGSLRVFSYPVVADRGYSRCLIEHLTNIRICIATPDCKRIVTYSSMDRCINIWEVGTKSLEL